MRRTVTAYHREAADRVVKRFLTGQRVDVKVNIHAPKALSPALTAAIAEMAYQVVATRPVEVKQTGRQLFPASEAGRFSSLIRSGVIRIAVRSANLAGLSVGRDEGIVASDPLVRRELKRSATRVVDITDKTRKSVVRQLRRGEKLGLSQHQIAFGSPGDNYRGLHDIVEETYKNRALAIARTELGDAANGSMLEAFVGAGVDDVLISDGDGCTWPRGHGESPFADGMTVSALEANDARLAHPNCVRSYSPIVGE